MNAHCDGWMYLVWLRYYRSFPDPEQPSDFTEIYSICVVDGPQATVGLISGALRRPGTLSW
jgi:hypothetical protein